jgi:hypothetical protein
MSANLKEVRVQYLVVILCAFTAVSAAGPLPATAVPVFEPTPYRAVSIPHTRDGIVPPDLNVPPGRLEEPLERLTPAERANAEIAFDLGPYATQAAQDEARSIEHLWNSGDFAKAIERLRNLPALTDPAQVFTSINWRVPIPTRAGTDWGTNVRIGNRDSAAHVVFDRNNTTGHLFVGIVSNAGPSTYLYMNMSTDNGLTWVETASGIWSAPHACLDISGVCSGNYFYAAYSSRVLPSCIRASRWLASNGLRAAFRNDSQVVTVLSISAADTFREVATTSSDDASPGYRIYAFGATTQRNLVMSYSDSFAQPWFTYATGVIGWCDGALSCTYNPGWSTRGLFAAWRYVRTDSTNNVGLAWYDTSDAFVHTYFNPSSPWIWVTSVAAYRDTVAIAYEHADGSIFYTRELFTLDNGSHWYWTWIPEDTMGQRENPALTACHGGGFAAVYRERMGTSARYLCYTHSPYTASTWSTPDTVSDWRPDVNEHPRVQWLGPGLYGVVYIKWSDEPGYSVWFNRSDFTGIAESPTPGPGPAASDLLVLTERGRVRFSFDNPAPGDVRLRICDAAGRVVHNESRLFGSGPGTFEFTGAAAGIYFARVDLHSRTAKAKFLLVQ